MLFINTFFDPFGAPSQSPAIALRDRSRSSCSLFMSAKAANFDANQPPSVFIAGGGPAGALTGVLLGRKGVNVKVFEKSVEPDAVGPRSDALRLNARGMNALEAAGILDRMKQYQFPFKATKETKKDGSLVLLNDPSEFLTIMRPHLTNEIIKVLQEEGNADFVYGKEIINVEPTEDGSLLKVTFNDNSIDYATHVVGADGKWSKVRGCVAEYEKKQPKPTFEWNMRSVRHSGPLPVIFLCLKVSGWYDPRFQGFITFGPAAARLCNPPRSQRFACGPRA
jgi:2-polyprenyl-6-methoxyphenol hydroxylase-like FAD-dependent oxidoreductase